jgi:hypothetical protein
MTPTNWEGDRELAKQRFLKSVALAVEVLPAVDLNFFAWRNLPDDIRACIGVSVEERRVALAVSERNKRNRRGKANVEDAVATTSQERTRVAVSKAARISERKLRTAREIKGKSAEVFAEVRAAPLPRTTSTPLQATRKLACEIIPRRFAC